MSLGRLASLAQRSDQVLGHIYEIEKIPKGSQDFKHHCSSYHIFAAVWDVPWMAEGKVCRVYECMATSHSAKLVRKGNPDCSVMYKAARRWGMWLSGFRISEGYKFIIVPLSTLLATFFSRVVAVSSCCTNTGLYLDFISTEQSCTQLTHRER